MDIIEINKEVGTTKQQRVQLTQLYFEMLAAANELRNNLALKQYSDVCREVIADIIVAGSETVLKVIKHSKRED